MRHEGPAICAQDRQLLLDRARTGDSEALNLLFASCRKRLYLLAFRILPRPQDAEDAVQEAMLAAFTHLDRFQGRADFLTWASRIVMNTALLQIRQARTKPTVSLDPLDDEFDASSYRAYLQDPRPTPEEQLQKVEHWALMECALNKLPLQSRRAIHLCKFAGYSVKQASRELGVSVSALKVRLHRGKQALIVRLKTETKVWQKAEVNKRTCKPRTASEPNLKSRLTVPPTEICQCQESVGRLASTNRGSGVLHLSQSQPPE